MEWTFSLDNIATVAAACWKAIGDKKIVAFHGEMGAGKTTFINALCDEKKVKDVVSSPTFSIVNEYAYDCEGTPKILFHMDLYRLRDEEEAIRSGVEDLLYSGNICLVEWPEKQAVFSRQITRFTYILNKLIAPREGLKSLIIEYI